MAKKTLFFVSALILIFSLTACSAIQLAWASASSSIQTASLSNFASQPVKNKLAVGLLSLQDSDLALTTTQAKDMLPLWMAVKSLSKDSNTTAGEMSALYVQIEGVLTANQLQAIQKLDLSTSELSALVQKYEGQTVVSASSSTTTTSQTAQSSQAQGGPGGGPGGDIQGIAMQDPGLGGIVDGSTTTTTTSTTKSSSTSASSTASQVNLNLQLAAPVISMLNARINSLDS